MLVAGLAAAAVAITVVRPRRVVGARGCDRVRVQRPAAARTGAAASAERGLAVGCSICRATMLAIAAPILAAAALAALLAHLAQTRALWLPRRRIDHAPALDRGPAARARSAAFDLLAVAVAGAVAFGWLWLFAPRIARLVELEPRAMLVAVGALGASLVATIACTWIAIGVLDALARHLELGNALAMTTAEKREDDRLASADPRWARQRALAAGDASSEGSRCRMQSPRARS